MQPEAALGSDSTANRPGNVSDLSRVGRSNTTHTKGQGSVPDRAAHSRSGRDSAPQQQTTGPRSPSWGSPGVGTLLAPLLLKVEYVVRPHVNWIPDLKPLEYLTLAGLLFAGHPSVVQNVVTDTPQVVKRVDLDLTGLKGPSSS